MKKKKQTKKEETRQEVFSEYFSTPIWSTQIPEWVDELNLACKPYLDESHERHAEAIKKNKGDDFGLVYHSTNIQYDPKLEEFSNYLINTCWNLLDSWGNNMSDYSLFFHSCWVQEFAKMVADIIECIYMKTAIYQVFIFYKMKIHLILYFMTQDQAKR